MSVTLFHLNFRKNANDATNITSAIRNRLKHIAFYNDKHELTRSIDFLHYHDGKKPHVHYDVYHNGQVTSPTGDDQRVIDQVKSWLSSRKK